MMHARRRPGRCSCAAGLQVLEGFPLCFFPTIESRVITKTPTRLYFLTHLFSSGGEYKYASTSFLLSNRQFILTITSQSTNHLSPSSSIYYTTTNLHITINMCPSCEPENIANGNGQVNGSSNGTNGSANGADGEFFDSCRFGQ